MVDAKRVMPARATIQDVAKHAGVTKSTVSKFLNPNDGYYVSPHTRERIETAIQDLDFYPNAIARGLTQNRTMTIGVISADIRNPFYPDLIAGVQAIVEPERYTVVLGSTNSEPEREQAILRSMIQRQVDGVILGSATLRIDALRSLVESGTRVLLASRNLPDLVTDTVVIDNYAGAQMAVDHLVELGHNRIGHIAGPQNVVPFQERLAGYRDAIARHGLPFDETVVLRSLSTPAAGAEAARRIIRHSNPPSAVFIANDNMALGAMDAAQRMRVRIPEDIAIVGFDNISLASNSFISLTSVDSRAEMIGRISAQVLLDRLAHGDVPPYEQPQLIVRAPKLHIRASTVAPVLGH